MSFLDKVYTLSSAQALTEFMKNPRPYLLPPLPLIPCKLAVLGPPLSGKSEICSVLAQRYNVSPVIVLFVFTTVVFAPKKNNISVLEIREKFMGALGG